MIIATVSCFLSRSPDPGAAAGEGSLRPGAEAGGRPALRRGVSTSPVTVTPRPSLWGRPLLSPRLKINPVGWNLDFSRAEDTALVGVKDRELPQATSLQASVSLVGTEPADLRVPSGYSQVHTGAQLGVTGLGGSYVSPGFPGPLLTPPLQGQVDRGQASAGRLRPLRHAHPRQMLGGPGLPCRPHPAMSQYLFPSPGSIFQNHPKAWAGRASDRGS